jgi:sulfite reductase alpha subunit-like flavoprotein
MDLMSIFKKKTPAEPTISATEKAASAFNKLSEHIESEIISQIKSQFSSSSAAVEGSDTVKMARIDEIAVYVETGLENAVNMLEVRSGIQYSSNAGFTQLIAKAVLHISRDLHDLHYGHQHQTPASVPATQKLLDILYASQEGKEALHAWTACYEDNSAEIQVDVASDTREKAQLRNHKKFIEIICEAIAAREIGDTSALKYSQIEPILSMYRGIQLNLN